MSFSCPFCNSAIDWRAERCPFCSGGIDPQTARLIGVARYVRGAEPQLAEVSVVVGDDWQRRGVATLLLEQLVERARAAGITHFVALVMDDNVDAIGLFEHRVPRHARPRRSASGHLEHARAGDGNHLSDECFRSRS